MHDCLLRRGFDLIGRNGRTIGPAASAVGYQPTTADGASRGYHDGHYTLTNPSDIGLRWVAKRLHVGQLTVDLPMHCCLLRRGFELIGRNGRTIAPAASAVGYQPTTAAGDIARSNSFCFTNAI